MQRNIIIISFGTDIFLAKVILIRAAVKGEKAKQCSFLRLKLIFQYSSVILTCRLLKNALVSYIRDFIYF